MRHRPIRSNGACGLGPDAIVAGSASDVCQSKLGMVGLARDHEQRRGIIAQARTSSAIERLVPSRSPAEVSRAFMRDNPFRPNSGIKRATLESPIDDPRTH
jgi:hypothetical protein